MVETGVWVAVRLRFPVPVTLPAVSATVLRVAVVETARKRVPMVKVFPLVTKDPALSLNVPAPEISTLEVIV